jgi:ATP-dependent DNA helicase DinG
MSPTSTIELNPVYAGAMKTLGLEPRPGQSLLVEAGIMLPKGQHGLVRAPTATGKSLAALMIGGLRAATGERTVIATYTKLLQDQYAHVQTLDSDMNRARQLFPAVDFRVLKGANNYLCRIAAADRPGGVYQRLAKGTGNPGELGTTGLVMARADWRLCKNHKPEECGYAAAKALAKAADVVVTNHALVLINSINARVLGEHALLIVDEIHNFPRAAEGFATERIDLTRAQNQVKNSGARYALGNIRDYLLGQGDREERLPSMAEIKAVIANWAPLKSSVGVVDEITALKLWVDGAVFYQRNKHHGRVLSSIAAPDRRAKDRVALEVTTVDIAAIAERGLRTELCLPETNDEPEVTPFDRAVLMMSATVGTPSRERYVADRCNVTARLLSVPSPIDYQGRMRVSQVFATRRGQTWGALVSQLVKETHGRSLVLCRSWRRVAEIYEALDAAELPFSVYVQDQAEPSNNAKVVKDFTADVSSVLVGTASFYEGIDVQGPSLSQVIIGELPMPMALSPIAKERQRRVGNRWQADVVIPGTALVLEQQMGRLLRTVGDRGLIAVLDEASKAGWGKQALAQALGTYGVGLTPRAEALAWFKA